jgi:predicted MFS family arabinose efflux permease
MRGRVFSTEFAVFTLASALGAALGGWVLDHTAFSLTTILLLIAVLALVPTCIWALWVLFGKRELPEEAQFMQAGGD